MTQRKVDEKEEALALYKAAYKKANGAEPVLTKLPGGRYRIGATGRGYFPAELRRMAHVLSVRAAYRYQSPRL